MSGSCESLTYGAPTVPNFCKKCAGPHAIPSDYLQVLTGSAHDIHVTKSLKMAMTRLMPPSNPRTDNGTSSA